jgi:arabinofuranosyltransferase
LDSTRPSLLSSNGAGLAERRVVTAALVAAFTYLFLANSWLGDDSYITFRVIWNAVHGYGLTFNPGERVQAYTHPLWMLIVAAAHVLTREFFFTALATSYAFSLAAVLVVIRHAGSIGKGTAAFLWLASSKAFIDYTSSGLENPLSYLLVALFYVRFLGVSDRALSNAELRRFGLLAGLACVNRLDSVLLFVPALTWLWLRGIRRPDERVWHLVGAFLIPAGGWLVFATLYYGFPLPNTYYAKVATGIPASLLYRQGFAYLLNSFGRDPITLGTVGLAAALAVRASTTPVRLAAAAPVVYVVYTITVGGDFMSGRFFALPFLGAAITLIHALKDVPYPLPAASALLVYNLLMPLVPFKTTAAYDGAWPWRSQNGVRDERGHQHRITNVFFFSPFRELPDHTWMREGRSFREGPDKVTVQGSIGFYGLMAGPEKHLVDRNALSDPLLARLPVSRGLYFEFYVGHFFRDIPEGYLESLEHGDNRLADPFLHGYYDRLLNVIKGPLFTASRMRDIWYLNVGDGRRFARRYDAQRPVALSIRAANERFLTDVGDRDAASGTIRSTGRAGYLQYGPGIPMKAAVFRARWVGTAPSLPGPLGFVDVWDGDRRLARREIRSSDIQPETHQLAEIVFKLDRPVNRLDYRIWIHGQVGVTLERVELTSVAGAGEMAP